MSTNPKNALKLSGEFFIYKDKVETLLLISQQLAMLGFEKDWTNIGQVEDVTIGDLLDELKYAYPDKLVRIQIDLQPKPEPCGLFDRVLASQTPVT